MWTFPTYIHVAAEDWTRIYDHDHRIVPVFFPAYRNKSLHPIKDDILLGFVLHVGHSTQSVWQLALVATGWKMQIQQVHAFCSGTLSPTMLKPLTRISWLYWATVDAIVYSPYLLFNLGTKLRCHDVKSEASAMLKYMSTQFFFLPHTSHCLIKKKNLVLFMTNFHTSTQRHTFKR